MFQRFSITIFVLLFLGTNVFAAQDKTVIYQSRLGGDYSLPALILASLHKPDFIELPLVLSKDDIPIVYSDIFLHPQTNVADLFPERNREDGKYYTTDFTAAELSQLSYAGNERSAGFIQHPATFADTLAALDLLLKRYGEVPQILPVIKFPWFYAKEGKDISKIILDALIGQAGSAEQPLYLKCYDPEELQRIQKSLLPGLPVEIKLVQGIDRSGGTETMREKRGNWQSYNYDWVFTRLGLRVLSGYADIITLAGADITGEETLTRLIDDSHALKIRVMLDFHEPPFGDPNERFKQLLFTLNLDGLATAEPDQLITFLQGHKVTDEKAAEPGENQAAEEKKVAPVIEADELSREAQEVR